MNTARRFALVNTHTVESSLRLILGLDIKYLNTFGWAEPNLRIKHFCCEKIGCGDGSPGAQLHRAIQELLECMCIESQ